MTLFNFSLVRAIVLGFGLCLTACSAPAPYFYSKKIDSPTEKINSLAIWYMQGVEKDNAYIDEYIPELVKSLEKDLAGKNISTKTITTGKLGLRTPQDEVNEFIRRTHATSILKIYMTNAKTITYSNSRSSETQVLFTINAELINSVDNHMLWKATIGTEKRSNIFTINTPIESIATELVNRMQADNVLNPVPH